MTCALVPPTPKALTAAVGTPAPGRAGQGRVRVLTSNAEESRSSRGFGLVKCKVGTSWRFSSISTVLMKPATPAAALVWPRLLLTAPSQIVRPPCAAAGPRASVSAATSTGSPIGVAVPWHSM